MDAGTAAEAVDVADSEPAFVDPRIAFVKHLACLANPVSGLWEQNTSVPLCTPERQGPGESQEHVVRVCPVNAAV